MTQPTSFSTTACGHASLSLGEGWLSSLAYSLGPMLRRAQIFPGEGGWTLRPEKLFKCECPEDYPEHVT